MSDRIHRRTTTTTGHPPPPPVAQTTTTRVPVATTTTTRAPVITPAKVTGQSAYRTLGNTTREAFVATMLRTVAGRVPFTGEINEMYDALAAKGVTRLAVPMSWMECKNSTYPTCGVPQWAKNPWSVTGEGDAGSTGRWAVYSTYEAAAKHWADLVTLGSPYRSAKSIADFIHIYAPGWDNNDERAYVQVIVDGVNALPVSGTAPAPAVSKDLLLLIFREPYTITQEWANLGPSADLYGYGAGRNPQLHGAEHPGLDVIGRSGKGGALHAPFAGQIVCAGTGNGAGAWGTGCAAFNDYTDGGGAGRLEMLHPDGKRSLILGHCDRATARIGERVEEGQQIATVGGMRGDHCHVEGRRWEGSDYGIYDPRVLFSDVTGNPGVILAPRVPVPQPAAFDYATDCVALEEVPVHQRADHSSPLVSTPIAKGEHFQAVYQVKAEDGEIWWIGHGAGRVPKKGTRCEGWP